MVGLTVGAVNGEPLQAGRKPHRGRGAEAFHISPFTRLARVHLTGAGGDALIAIALAGSLFFNLDPDSARPKVALYLLLTIAPFAVVGPLIGPLIDRARGGQRGMVDMVPCSPLAVATSCVVSTLTRSSALQPAASACLRSLLSTSRMVSNCTTGVVRVLPDK